MILFLMVLLGKIVLSKKSPFKDFTGSDLFEGDKIKHPSGCVGIIVYDESKKKLGTEWRVKYLDTQESLWLGNQVGGRGMAVKLSDG